MTIFRSLSLENLTAVLHGEFRIEEWKEIAGYEGLYSISNFGRIRSHFRQFQIPNRYGVLVTINVKDRILSPSKTPVGYYRTILSISRYQKTFSIHRLVITAFTPNPLNLPQINHISGDKEDNSIWNLEWCTPEYNQQHAYDTGLNIPKRSWEDPQSKPVALFKNGIELKRFGSLGEASQVLGVSRGMIKHNCLSKRNILRGPLKDKKCQFL